MLTLSNFKQQKGYTFLFKFVSKIEFSTSASRFEVNPLDGTDLDNTSEIVDYCNSSKEVESYFQTKESSIRNSYRIESNSAAIEGIPASELSS